MGWEMYREGLYNNCYVPIDMSKITPGVEYIGTVADINEPDPKIESISTVGAIVYSMADDMMYVYNGSEFEPLYDNEEDNKSEPVKIRRRTNCCNCGAPLPDTSGSKVKCKYCDTVQSVDKDDQEVLEGPKLGDEYTSPTSATFTMNATSPTFTSNDDYAKAEYINYHIGKLRRRNGL